MPLKYWRAALALVAGAPCLSACSGESKPQTAAITDTTTGSSAPPVDAYGGTGSLTVAPTSEEDTQGGTSTTGTAEGCTPSDSGTDYYLHPDECAHCHADDASGVPGLGPEVRNPAPDYARWIIKNGRAGHPQFADGMPAPSCAITDTAIDQVLTFLGSFGKATEGFGLYEDFCAGCHGDDGRGGVTQADLNGQLDALETVSMTGHTTGDYGDRNSYMPVMTDRLTAAELELIRAYLEDELGLEG